MAGCSENKEWKAAREAVSSQAAEKAHLLRWRPRPHAQRGSLALARIFGSARFALRSARQAESTPGVRPSGAVSHLDLFEQPAVFLHPATRLRAQADARRVLSRPFLDTTYRTGVPKIMLSAEQMRTLPEFFADIPDPRRTQGRRHPLPVVLSIAAGAILCGMRGYKAIADWAQSLSPKARARFRCRGKRGRYRVPSESIIRDCLIRLDPLHLDRALQRWNEIHGQADESLAIGEMVVRLSVLDQVAGELALS